ncbi:MAG: hypothetical protein ACM3JD_04140 [Rudaea sp.]
MIKGRIGPNSEDVSRQDSVYPARRTATHGESAPVATTATHPHSPWHGTRIRKRLAMGFPFDRAVDRWASRIRDLGVHASTPAPGGCPALFADAAKFLERDTPRSRVRFTTATAGRLSTSDDPNVHGPVAPRLSVV